MSKSVDSLWYAGGLRFACTQCGNCCTGAPGFVWVNDAEIDALAHRCGESVDGFKRIYTHEVGQRITLNELEDGSCVFYRPGVGCTVYEDRPRQCRTWPFWDSNLASKDEWKETGKGCPGLDQGRLYTVEEIVAQSRVIRL